MKKGKLGFIVKIMAVFSFVVAIFACGYFSLDKVIIPRNFAHYGISSIKDLTNVFASLYGVPDEKDIVENGYAEKDLESAVEKLQNAGYKIEDDGTILQENILSFKDNVKEQLFLTNNEITAVCDKLVQSGILAQNLQHLNYIDVVNISVLDFVITPDKNSYDEETSSYGKANVKSIVKINTKALCEQMAIQMETTEALLNVIIPENMYFTIDYDIDLRMRSDSRAVGTISVNGKKAEKSEVLINLLIDFIFPKEDEMTFDKFTKAIGDVALSAIDTLGQFNFVVNETTKEIGLMFS